MEISIRLEKAHMASLAMVNQFIALQNPPNWKGDGKIFKRSQLAACTQSQLQMMEQYSLGEMANSEH